MKRTTRRLTAYLVLAMTSLGIMLTSLPAGASKAGRENTARALTGVAAYELLRGHTSSGLLLGGAAYYAWQQAKKTSHHRHRVYSHRLHRYVYR